MQHVWLRRVQNQHTHSRPSSPVALRLSSAPSDAHKLHKSPGSQQIRQARRGNTARAHRWRSPSRLPNGPAPAMQITHCRPAPSWAAPRAPHAALRCAALLRAPPVRPERPQQHGVFVPVGKPRLRFAGGDQRGGRAGGWRRTGAAAAAAAAPRYPRPAAYALLRPPLSLPRAAAAVGVSDGINTQKPSLMADTLEQHVPPPPIRCGAGAGRGVKGYKVQGCVWGCVKGRHCWCRQQEGRTVHWLLRAGRVCPAVRPNVLPPWQHALPPARPASEPARPPVAHACPASAPHPGSPCPLPSRSKTDEQFVGEGVEFVWGADGIDIDELNALFEKVNWSIIHFIDRFFCVSRRRRGAGCAVRYKALVVCTAFAFLCWHGRRVCCTGVDAALPRCT